MKFNKILRDVGDSLLGSSAYAFNPASLHGAAYPIDWDFTLQNQNLYFADKDDHGVPVNRDNFGEVVYFPTRVATYALAHFNRYAQCADATSRELFLRMATWFMAAEDGIWRYHCDYHIGAEDILRGPWISAMAQGEGISILTRAYRLTREERYLARARLAVAPLLVPVDEGGVRSWIDRQSPFLEEYPLPAPRHVLNGFLFTLIGLVDLVDLVPEERERVGIDQLAASLTHHLALWDFGPWSAYDAYRTGRGRRNPATVAYHRVHVAQLRWLGARLGIPLLEATADRWFAGQRQLRHRLAALGGKLALRAFERSRGFRAVSRAAADDGYRGSK
jgi:heparosan-N-sulfate-glucuronate 5-epimerase